MSLFDEGEGDDAPSPEHPILPYAGSSGWSGSDTSHARADHDDTSGATAARQREVMRFLSARRSRGATWRELAEEYEWHHGQASGPLSVLHKTRLIARLTETRLRCKVYVLPDYVDGRPTEAHQPNTQKARNVLAERLADLFLDYIDQRGDSDAQFNTWLRMREVADDYREQSL